MLSDGEPNTKRRSRAQTGGSQKSASPSTRDSAKLNAPHTDVFPVEADLLEPQRPNTSIIRYNQPSLTRITSDQPTTSVPPRRQNQNNTTREFPRQPRTTTPHPFKAEKQKPRRNVHWLVLVGVGMMAALVLWVAGNTALAWGMQRYNDIKYGNPRTYQVDAVVGHGNDSKDHPSHFIAVNLNRQAIVIELMAGDPAKSASYVAPIYIVGDGGDLAPVTVDFRDANADGKVDMLIRIHIPNQTDQLSVFINDGAKFRPSNGNDKLIGATT